VAILRVVERFESHAEAAIWYTEIGLKLPSNCMVAGNAPEPFDKTNQYPPKEIQKRLRDLTADQALRLWDYTYQQRVKQCSIFLACEKEYLDLSTPPAMRLEDMKKIFGRVRGTQTPPQITEPEYAALKQIATREPA
jgi:hypothetical protein